MGGNVVKVAIEVMSLMWLLVTILFSGEQQKYWREELGGKSSGESISWMEIDIWFGVMEYSPFAWMNAAPIILIKDTTQEKAATCMLLFPPS